MNNGGNFTHTAKINLGNLNWPVIEESTTNYAYNNAFLPIVIASVFLCYTPKLYTFRSQNELLQITRTSG